MSMQKPDVAKMLSAHIAHELQGRVEDLVVSRFMERIQKDLEQVEQDVRSIVREATKEWTLGEIEHVRSLMSLAEDLNIELVVTEKQEKAT
ncbi:hypothetical protein [Marinobacter sp. OP 3.4]|uniref:hypothetical protein n=1 Tax=Marinobacter sp. OP 3.4 TaxID=3076501 RepID=UPI002E1D1EB3